MQAMRRQCDTDMRCRRCLARWYCAGGCHVTRGSRHLGDTDDDFCRQTRLILIARLLRRIAGWETAEAFLADEAGIARVLNRSSDLLEEGLLR